MIQFSSIIITMILSMIITTTNVVVESYVSHTFITTTNSRIRSTTSHTVRMMRTLGQQQRTISISTPSIITNNRKSVTKMMSTSYSSYSLLSSASFINKRFINNSNRNRLSLSSLYSTTKNTDSTSSTSSTGVTSTTENDNIIRPITTSSDTTIEEVCHDEHMRLYKYDEYNIKYGLSDKYEPKLFESYIYKWYEINGCFLSDSKLNLQPSQKDTNNNNNRKKRMRYVLPMPPPNVTGKLHMGHAIFITIQDILSRYHRMRNKDLIWIPGTDHAGIATQLQVEKLIAPISRQEIGRTEFIKHIYTYKNEQSSSITNQLRILGSSCDWTRETFTMDNNICEAVIEAFIQLYNKNLIYQGEYIVNWSTLLQTAISDLEVDYTEELGKLYYFKYQLVESDGDDIEYIPVATTRPETILGDTALCVNPNDIRYQKYIGKHVIVPMSNGRTIPIIADEYVDIEFGTGALKITPGHDHNDYSIGKTHHLPIINIMNKDGTMNENSGKYNGLDRFICREHIWNDLVSADIAIKVDNNYIQRIPRSQRGNDIIEPMISTQWFLNTETMAKKALNAVVDGHIQIIPSRFEKTWEQWLSNNRDWCISRQLWWGHRIPVWYIIPKIQTESTSSESSSSTAAPKFIVARNDDDAKQKAIDMGYDINKIELKQDDDVLDTWFSSGLWPFATVGWPNINDSPDYNRYYPATCLETGYDILFFWVARMVMLGIELTDQYPFQVIYLHGLVRAADGSKMSKTKGNVIDPIDTVEQYGTDSLRYSLVTGNTPGQDIPLNIDKIVANRQFANKLWNCCKFVINNALGPDITDDEMEHYIVNGPMEYDELKNMLLPEQYIISKCHILISSVTEELEQYSFGSAGNKIYEFLWDEYADWYIEISKTRLYVDTTTDGNEIALQHKIIARRVLVYILDRSLRLLHPYMPYVTEQLWHHLPRRKSNSNDDNNVNALMLADWPQMPIYHYENDDKTKEPTISDENELAVRYDVIQQFEYYQLLVRKIRNARAEYNVEQGKKIQDTIILCSGPMKDMIQNEIKSIISLTRLDADTTFIYNMNSIEATNMIRTNYVQLIISDTIEVYLPLNNLLDPVKEKARLLKEYTKLQKDIEKLQIRLSSPGFTDKAPPAILEKTNNELNELLNQSIKIKLQLDTLEV